MTQSERKQDLLSKPYTWGKLQTIHEIGEYLIVEYLAKKFISVCETQGLESEPSFHPYINGIDTNNSYDSLDAALAGAIGYKHDGCNSRAAMYFMKMILPD